MVNGWKRVSVEDVSSTAEPGGGAFENSEEMKYGVFGVE